MGRMSGYEKGKQNPSFSRPLSLAEVVIQGCVPETLGALETSLPCSTSSRSPEACRASSLTSISDKIALRKITNHKNSFSPYLLPLDKPDLIIPQTILPVHHPPSRRPPIVRPKPFGDFAGQEIECKKLVDADSKAALDKAKISVPYVVDAILEQIKKKQKLSVPDKMKKDWGEFKEENKGLEDELDAYKKSSNQYLDKVFFLQRTDYREFEWERDARLAVQAKRRLDM
ncbi:hypothetical protein UlMin_019140 [Ulmus minor]